MMPTSATDVAICLYLADCFNSVETAFSGSSCDSGSVSIRSSNAMRTLVDISRLAVESLGDGRRKGDKPLGSEKRHEVFVRKQAAEGVDNKQQPALGDRGFLYENPLAIGFLPVRSDESIGGDPACAPLALAAIATSDVFAGRRALLDDAADRQD